MLGAALGLVGLVVVGVDESAADAATVSAPVRADYTAALHKVFTVQHRGRTHRLTLTAVQNLPHTSIAERQRCFSLLFTPARSSALPEGIYAPKCVGVPTHSLFLTHVGTARTLQAIVNRA
ncbi:MAG: DUF6916 family protein [Jatrophihabitantaceae bacterium]